MTHLKTPKTLAAGLAGLGLLFSAGCAGTEALAAGTMGDALAAAAGIPQMDAFLPYAETVPETEALVIDGDYKISTLGKRIRIERGRAWALDPWTHALTLKIRRGMVVTKDIVQVDATTFTGYDLPLLGTSTMVLQPDGRIAVTVQGIPPYQFVLLPEDGGSLPDVGDDDSDGVDGCETLDVDPQTGELICLD